MATSKTSNSVRIIGGRWRGRRLSFPSADGLRPTHDRLRETVFNWLMRHVVGARCLDLFAGSGALGFEALSRGARSVTFVETNQSAINSLHQHIMQLAANDLCHVIHADYRQASLADDQFDLVFLDPPYSLVDYNQLLDWLALQSWLSTETLVYIERPAPSSTESWLNDEWQWLKHQSTSTIEYGLLRLNRV